MDLFLIKYSNILNALPVLSASIFRNQTFPHWKQVWCADLAAELAVLVQAADRLPVGHRGGQEQPSQGGGGRPRTTEGGQVGQPMKHPMYCANL